MIMTAENIKLERFERDTDEFHFVCPYLEKPAKCQEILAGS
jgi:uncharacterized protein YozE (UPF0346 family)